MKLIQKILSHGLMLVFFTAVFVAYTHRSAWFPQWFGSTAKTTQSHTIISRAAPAPDIAQTGRIPVTPSQAKQTPITAVTVEPVKPDSDPQPIEPITADDGADTRVEATDAEPAQAPNEKAANLSVPPQQTIARPASAQPASAANAAIARVAATADAGEQTRARPTPADSAPENLLDNRLQDARRHYWQRDLRGAAMAYQALGEDYPTNPDVWGEMGNVYFGLHRREPAANAYARCVELLIEQHEPIRARQLLNILYRLDAPAAYQLEARIRHVGG